jgi:hypothetical protein
MGQFALIAKPSVAATSPDMIMIAMMENGMDEETDLVDAAVLWLQQYLPASWKVGKSSRTIVGGDAEPQRLTEGAIDVQAPHGIYTTFAVEAKRSFAPRDVERLVAGFTRILRTLAGNVPVLVVAPWLSARSRELLRAEGINYLDLTGNAHIQLDNPALFIKSQGAERNPEPPPRDTARVRGPKAARLIRLLVDVRPPYGVGEIAKSTDLAPGYVSRLLDALDRDALVDRGKRGQVESVDIAGLLRRWAETYDVLKTNQAATCLAPDGAQRALSRLAEADKPQRTAVTGSFAAVRLAPVAAPALLLLYCVDERSVADTLGLLPADEGANVALLRPFEQVVWQRAQIENGLTYVAPSQIVVDCLTGTGRMPAEGEAILKWMIEHEATWRYPSINAARETMTPS